MKLFDANELLNNVKTENMPLLDNTNDAANEAAASTRRLEGK